jgi:uncharacterized protein
MLEDLEARLLDWLQSNFSTDVGHDLLHIKRVVASSKRIAEVEGGNLAVVIPAAYLHDCVIVPKDSPDRSRASTLAGEEAVRLLREWGYEEKYLEDIKHAIEAHSFSAGIEPRTLEAKIVQDADRLDAIGAIGIARCLALGGAMGSDILSADDPFCKEREPDDKKFMIDHFYVKLFKLEGMMNTDAGKQIAGERVLFMKEFLRVLEGEVV